MKHYSPELWDVLAYAGVWNASPEVAPVETFEIPTSNKVFLLGYHHQKVTKELI
jgi:hypothetical protein